MKLRIRRSGRKQAADRQERDQVNRRITPADSVTISNLGSGRCQGIITRTGQRCLLDAGPDGYCVFHKPPGAAA